MSVLTIEKPANNSFTNTDIRIGSSKLPIVTAFTASRDYRISLSAISDVGGLEGEGFANACPPRYDDVPTRSPR